MALDAEQLRQMDRTSEALSGNSIYDWAASVVTEISRIFYALSAAA